MSTAQITVEDRGTFKCGSAALYKTANQRWFYTCAHNVVAVDPMDITRKRFFNNIDAYRTRVGADVWGARYPITHVYVHPKYDGSPWCGYDIAVLICGDDLGESHFSNEYRNSAVAVIDNFTFEIDPNEVVGLEVQIAGYPGDADKKGYLYCGAG